jgi:hypothetical protein
VLEPKKEKHRSKSRKKRDEIILDNYEGTLWYVKTLLLFLSMDTTGGETRRAASSTWSSKAIEGIGWNLRITHSRKCNECYDGLNPQSV